MLLGTYEHTIDDKNRLTLPARLRESFADGIVVTRGIERCLDAYRREDWVRHVESRLATLDPLSKETRKLQRLPLLGSVRGPTRQTGPRDDLRAAHRARGAARETSSWSESATTSRSGIATSGTASSQRSKGVLKMLPSVLQRRATDHIPVLAEEVRRLLAVRPGETVVDGTFGAGGHAALLAADLQGSGRYIAVDRDPTVRPYFDEFKLLHASLQPRLLRGDFSIVLRQLADNDVEADAVLLDLGVSSMQIDLPERGFSYAVDAPLDMRMDPSTEPSAADLVNEAPERELDRHLPAPRGRALRAADRAGCRPSPAADDDVRARGRHPLGDSAAAELRRRPSGQACLPGAAHRRQRRARRAGERLARGPRRCCVRAAASP